MHIAVHLDLPLSDNRNDYHPQHISDLKHKYCLSVLHNFQYIQIKVVLTFYSLAVSLCTTRFNIKKFYMVLALLECFLRISEQTPTFALYVINWSL
jgi:hypothetical protein